MDIPWWLTRRIRTVETCDQTYEQWQSGAMPCQFVSYRYSFARWPLVALVAVVVLFCAVFASAAEKGKPFVPPAALVPEPRLEIVADQLPVSSRAGCPLDASVIIDVAEGPNHWTFSGTCVDSEEGRSLIATCAHQWRIAKNPVIRVTHQKKDYSATVVCADDVKDLAILSVDAELPAVDLVIVKPIVGDTVTSVGLSGEVVGEKTLKITGVDLYDRMRNFETDGKEFKGRSGGGLFFNGQFCGVIQATRNDISRSVYGGVDSVREMLLKSHRVASSARIAVTLWKAPFHCAPCDRSERNLVGDERFDVTVKIGPAPFMTPEWLERNRQNGYPYFEHDGQIYFGYTTADGLAKLLGSESPPPVSSGPVGATIEGRSSIDSMFSTIEKYAGRSASFKLLWKNTDGKKVLPIGQEIDFDEIRGTAGRVEFSCDAASVPLKQLSFDYQFINGKIRFKLTGEAEVDAPADGVVSSSGPVGDPVTVLYTIFSVAKTVWDLCHPTVSFVLPETLEARSSFTGDELNIDCDGTGPALRLNWRLFWGLLRWEMNRPLTGLSISRERVELQFHRSKWFKSVVVEVK